MGFRISNKYKEEIRSKCSIKRRIMLCFINILIMISFCNFYSQASSIHSWDFKSVTTSNFVDSGSGTAANFAQSTNYIANDYGVHLAFEKLTKTTADIFQDDFFTIYGWFYSHLSTSYYLFCEQDSAIDRFCLSVSPSGYYTISFTNSVASSQSKLSTISAKTGWNFFYIKLQLSFGYTTATLGVVNNQYSPIKQTSSIIFNGNYAKATKTFNIGCRVVNSVCTESFLGSIRSLTIDNTVVADATLDALYSSTCTNDGYNACGICAISGGTGKCYEVIEATQRIKYLNLDITSTTTASTTVSDLSGDSHTFAVSTSAPYRIPLQGYRFGYGKYIKASSGFTLPNSFTINCWFRMDTTDKAPDTRLQYLYLKSLSGSSKFYIGVNNNFLRIYINGAIYDYSVSLGTNSSWRYLSVSIYPTSSSATGVQIFLDSTKLSSQTLMGVLTDSTSYDVYIGKDFEGNIYSFEITPLLNVDISTPRMLFTGSCTSYGSTSCTVCPKTSTTAGTCLSACSLGTYDQNCNSCNWRCKYCTAAGSNCISCASALSGTGAAPVTCTCRPGYYDATSSCVACNSLCGTCSGSGSTNCLTCAITAYRYGTNTCLSSCPTYYKVNSNYRTCELDTTSLLSYVYDSTSTARGCTYNQYWSGSSCQSCSATCLTCNGGASSNCLSCPIGRYLNSKSCLTCDSTYMVVGTDGMCVETCGKSKNFGLLACDNGNQAGCINCVVQDYYTCSGGSTTTPDICTYSYPSFSSIYVSDENNLFIYFDREMKAVSNITTSTFKIEITDSSGSSVTDFTWTIPSDYYTEFKSATSSRYIFIALNINSNLDGGSNAAKVKVTYSDNSGTAIFKDLNGAALKNSTSISGKLNSQFIPVSGMNQTIITVIGILCSFSTFALIPLILGFKGGSREGMIIIALGLQLVYFSSLINYKFSSEFMGFMQFLRFTSLEFDSMPNAIKILMNQGSRTEELIRNNDSNFYDIATTLEMNPFKLLILFIFNMLCLIFSLIPFCIKNKNRKIKLIKINELLIFQISMIIFMLVYCPFGFSAFAEVENIERTSPYKIVSVSATFVFIMIMIIFIVTLIKTLFALPILSDKKVQERFNMLHIGMKRKKLALTFYPIMFGKLILCIICVVAFCNSFAVMNVMLLLLCLLSGGFFIYLKPFVLKQGNILVISSEIILSIYFLCGIFSNQDSVMMMTAIGWLQIILILFFIGISVTLGIICSFKTAVSKIFEEKKTIYEKDADKGEMQEAKTKLEQMMEEEGEEEEEEEELEVEEVQEVQELEVTKEVMVSRSGRVGSKKKKKRTKAKIGLHDGDRIGVFESIESDKTGDKQEEFEEVWVEEEEEEAEK